MQDPTPAEGGIIKYAWFKNWLEEDPPDCEFVIQTYDTAFSAKTTADYSVMQTWGIFEKYEIDSVGTERFIPNLILLGNVRGRFEYPELRSIAQEEFEKLTTKANLAKYHKKIKELEAEGKTLNIVYSVHLV